MIIAESLMSNTSMRIPAFINQKGALELGHNGKSSDYIPLGDFANVVAEEFKFFCYHKYKNAPIKTHFF